MASNVAQGPGREAEGRARFCRLPGCRGQRGMACARPGVGSGSRGGGRRGTLRHVLYFDLAEEWGQVPRLLHPGSAAAASRRRMQTHSLSSPPVTPEAVGHVAVARVCPEREAVKGGRVCMCVPTV